ncbi:MAG: 1-deoxy-D-xylulose-5-phosphate reductoisomerase [Longimicrobiales bacterium]|nr:1-deoxy-D-xylulose-5-phosphate reductoisomerase [Longimicrobiales bacterium]
MIRIAVLGSTGSIGRSALAVVRRHPDRFRVTALSARRRVDVLAAQVAEFRPARAVLSEVPGSALPDTGGGTRWTAGREALVELAASDDVDVVVNALVGSAGLEPTLHALAGGKRLALANKESLVAGGALVLEAARRGGGRVIPVDSEHSAILQCMHGADPASVRRLILTASGGPFRGWERVRLAGVTPADALRHPTWDMGAKITIDSATLANKALEVIEGHFLFGVPYARIEAVVHPQSIVHSFVEFRDGSVLAQVGNPDMELPILYALTHPERVGDPVLRTFDPVRASPLTFEPVDREAFPLFALGVDAGAAGGVAPAVFNAANEVAVEAFLGEAIGFLDMAPVVEQALEAVGGGDPATVEDVLHADRSARSAARAGVERMNRKRSSRQG